MSRVISRRYLGKVAGELLKFLNETAKTTSDLKALSGSAYAFGEGRGVHIRRWRSQRGWTYTISYNEIGKGTSILEVQIGALEGRSTLKVKCESPVEGYAEVERAFGNIIQKRQVNSARILDIKEELKKLAGGPGTYLEPPAQRREAINSNSFLYP